MKFKTKKIIAREGLIFLCIIIVSLVLGFMVYRHFWERIAPTLNANSWEYFAGFKSGYSLTASILFFVLSLYFIYLSIRIIIFIFRFIFWAIKTLKTKERDI